MRLVVSRGVPRSVSVSQRAFLTESAWLKSAKRDGEEEVEVADTVSKKAKAYAHLAKEAVQEATEEIKRGTDHVKEMGKQVGEDIGKAAHNLRDAERQVKRVWDDTQRTIAEKNEYIYQQESSKREHHKNH